MCFYMGNSLGAPPTELELIQSLYALATTYVPRPSTCIRTASYPGFPVEAILIAKQQVTNYELNLRPSFLTHCRLIIAQLVATDMFFCQMHVLCRYVWLLLYHSTDIELTQMLVQSCSSSQNDVNLVAQHSTQYRSHGKTCNTLERKSGCHS